MDEETAIKSITILLGHAYTALEDAEKLANEYGLAFNFDPALGMGGTYYSENSKYKPHILRDMGLESGWVSSSSQC